MPQAFGVRPSDCACHACGDAGFAMLAGGSVWAQVAIVGVVLVALLLLYEHLIISPQDMRRMNAAFFTLNG